MEAKPPLRFRKLRIACVVAVFAAWLSSHFWYVTAFCGTRHKGITVQSLRGECQVCFESNTSEYELPNIGIRVEPVSGEYSDNSDVRQFNWGGIWGTWNVQDALFPTLRQTFFGCKYYWLVLVSLAILLIPNEWLRLRFSLRTLLIATTVVAVGLGLIIWLARK
jgi:hypothetical protein